MSDVVVVALTDGDAAYDVRRVTAEELGQLNETAQDVTEGELWWEVIDSRRSSHAETLNGPGQCIRPSEMAMLDEGVTQMGLAVYLHCFRAPDGANPSHVGIDRQLHDAST